MFTPLSNEAFWNLPSLFSESAAVTSDFFKTLTTIALISFPKIYRYPLGILSLSLEVAQVPVHGRPLLAPTSLARV